MEILYDNILSVWRPPNKSTFTYLKTKIPAPEDANFQYQHIC